MALLSIKRVFKQHASLVVTVPDFVKRHLDIQKGDYVVFEWDPGDESAKFYKWHKGVERSHPDYGYKDLRDTDRAKRAKRGN